MRHVGIDLGLRGPHKAAVFEDGRPLGRPFDMTAGQAGIDALLGRALADGGSGPCEVVMEPTGLAWLPLAAELDRRGHQVFMPNGAKLSALRKFYSRHAKSDSVDAFAQGMVRHVDPTGTHPLVVPSASATMLRMFVKQRARLAADIGRAKTRVRSWLVLAGPGLNQVLGGEKAFSVAGRAFLRDQLDPFVVRDHGREALEAFWAEHAHHNADVGLVDALWQTTLQTCDAYEALREEGRLPFDYELLQVLVRNELQRIESLEGEIAALESHIDRIYADVDPDRVLQREIPGFGTAIAPTMEAFIGPVGRFKNIGAFAAYFGFVPRTRQTGGQAGAAQPMTKSGPNLAKQYLFLAADVARRLDPELAVTYQQAIDRGRHHIDAVCIVGHQLLRRTYALLRLREARKANPDAPPATWRYIDPETGELLSKKAARAWVLQNCPSKAAQRRQAMERQQPATHEPSEGAAGVPDTGSSEKNATTTSPGSPEVRIPRDPTCGKAVDNLVENLVKALRPDYLGTAEKHQKRP